jgi:hypothetical protein
LELGKKKIKQGMRVMKKNVVHCENRVLCAALQETRIMNTNALLKQFPKTLLRSGWQPCHKMLHGILEETQRRVRLPESLAAL